MLNVLRASPTEVFKNEELNTVINCLGTDIGEDLNLSKLAYNKVIIGTDSDYDGYHIQCLLLAFFHKYMKELIETGHVYIAMPPLYRLSKNSKIEYAYDDEELQKKLKTFGKCEISRYKGLGEMSAQQLWETTMDPNSRELIQVTIEDAKKAEKIMNILMGSEASIRKEWINSNVEFVNEDNFEIN